MAELFRAALVKNFFTACNESAQESYVIAKDEGYTIFGRSDCHEGSKEN
ncbi:hypothetical protein [Selenomonas sp. FC4001]|nr:hypothetical protein [Selenomonas sp. FC4001]